jgi:MoxR-like ATPase
MNVSPEIEPTGTSDHLKAVEFCRESYANIQNELAKVVVGQSGVLEEILIAIFTRSHALLVGVPGLAKTLMISTLAQTLQMSFKRVQFTPDLMPSDITGTEVIYSDQTTGDKQFKFLPGPLFANIVLADEINRTPPKTQAAMLEAMQERKVTVGGTSYTLPKPFFVLATQNPLEQEGTYPLPEAQLDRFMFLINVGYSIIKRWRSQGMPLIDGKITLHDAVTWRKSQPSEAATSRVEVQLPSTTVLNHPLLAAGRSCGPKSKNG